MRERIEQGERSFSFEFFPPKDAEGEEQLWRAITELEPYDPTFVSVTYGAGGSATALKNSIAPMTRPWVTIGKANAAIIPASLASGARG